MFFSSFFRKFKVPGGYNVGRTVWVEWLAERH